MILTKFIHFLIVENGPDLKMHTYRATLEQVIRSKYPQHARARIQIGKKAYLWPYNE